MSTLAMLDVAIGMIFIFLLISLVCTAINEIIESWLKKRGKDLERGITELLDGTNGSNLTNQLYNHPLILGLIRGNFNPGGRNLPSYIPARNFALALMDIVLPANPNNPPPSSVAAANAANASATAATTVATTLGTAAASEASAAAVQEAAAAAAVTTNTNSLVPFKSAIGALPASNAKQALLTLVDAAGDDINKVRENIEAWYNSSMDRVSGWYKRRVQWILLAVGFAVAGLMNADSIAIFKSLSNDPALRNTVVAAAQEYAKNENKSQDNTGQDAANGVGGSNTPDEGAINGRADESAASTTTDSTNAGTQTSPATEAVTNNTTSEPTKAGETPEERIEKAMDQLNELRMPIGWDWEDPLKTVATARTTLKEATGAKEKDIAKIAAATINLKKAVNDSVEYVSDFNAISNRSLAIPTGLLGWIYKGFGWLITGMAVSLGAPFWFDLLNKFMVIRSTVKPHEKSPEESSEDRQR